MDALKAIFPLSKAITYFNISMKSMKLILKEEIVVKKTKTGAITFKERGDLVIY